MDKIETILVGVDFSERSLNALRQAIRVARWNEAALHVIHVVEKAPIEDLAVAMSANPDDLGERIRKQQIGDLKEWFDRAKLPRDLSPEVVIGSPLDGILEKAKSLSADLLALGASGYSDDTHRAGMIAIRCVRSAKTKTLLVRGDHRGSFTKVLACVDFSDTSEEVVDQAVSVASQDGAQLELLHIHHAPWEQMNLGFLSPGDLRDYKYVHLDTIRNRLEQYLLCRKTAVAGLDTQCRVFEFRTPWEGIVKYARDDVSDIIVLGNRGRTDLKGMLLGSTAERVIGETSESVLTVRANGDHLGAANGETAANGRKGRSDAHK